MARVGYPKCLKIYLTNLSAQAKKFWISLGICSPWCDQYSTAHTKYSIYQYFPRLAMNYCSGSYISLTQKSCQVNHLPIVHVYKSILLSYKENER